MSRTRQAADPAPLSARNASADANACVPNPCAFNRRTSPFSMLGSSSTTAMVLVELSKMPVPLARVGETDRRDHRPDIVPGSPGRMYCPLGQHPARIRNPGKYRLQSIVYAQPVRPMLGDDVHP